MELRGKQSKTLRKRHFRERVFKSIGIAAVVISIAFLALLLYNLISRGSEGFFQPEVQLEIFYDPAIIDKKSTGDPSKFSGFNKVLKNALINRFPDIEWRKERKELLQSLLYQFSSAELRKHVINNPKLLGTTQKIWLKASMRSGRFVRDGFVDNKNYFSEKTQSYIKDLHNAGQYKISFSTSLFTNPDSAYPEKAGILGALTGSIFMIIICLAFCLPIGVITAIYLEEFAPKNKFTDFVEVNINNLAAVPSIVYGLLGLAVYINFMDLPRSAPITGGLTLALLILPVIIISSRASIKSVPPSIKQAALGMGSSPMQVVFHHTLPLALPGIMTGTILGVSRAIGETAPLLIIGMNAFVMDIPKDMESPTPVMPTLIFRWAGESMEGFTEKTSAAILVLLAILVALNLFAVIIRRRFERRW